MKINRLVLMLLVVLVGTIIGLRAEEKQPDPKIPDLIKQLGAEDFQMRESAHQALIKIGEPALEALRKASKSSQDPEIRMRTNMIIAEIEAFLSVKDLAKNWGEEVWYRMISGPRGEAIFIRCITKEDTYNKKDVFRFEDIIEGGILKEGQFASIKIITFCRKDKTLSPVYMKFETSQGEDKIGYEIKFEQDKAVVVTEGKEKSIQIPQSFLTINTLPRFLTLLPFKPGTTVVEVWMPEEHEIEKFEIKFIGQESIKGKPIYKFSTNPVTDSDEPLMVWVNEKRQIIKMLPPGGRQEMEITRISKEQAEKEIAELKKMMPPDEEPEENKK